MTVIAKQVESQKWSEIYPEFAATEVLTEDCYSPEVFERERDLLFRRTWMFVARAEDIPAAGNYLVREFPGLKASVILVRGRDGKIRGFHNVCRHRCAKLLNAGEKGSTSRIVCEFHGWGYDLDGSLVSLPDADGYLDKSRLGLVPIHTDTWNGFVFINFDRAPNSTLQQFLGGLATHPINDFPFEGEWESWGWQVETNANWKVVKDLFSETYHVAFVHRHSVHTLYSSPSNPFIHFPAVKFYGPHYQMTAPGSENPMGAPGILSEMSVKFGGAKNSRFGKAKNAAPGINPEGVKDWSVDTYGIFPNFNINIFGNLWHYFIFEPIDEKTTRWENRIFFPKAKNAGERFAHEFSQSIQLSVGLEDMSAAERNQAGIETGSVPKLELHDQEIAIRQFRKSIADFMSAQAGR
jgi:phenylpropionate dioxygenase-like ring-hydroxylating dioxygenase large terminal subunit